MATNNDTILTKIVFDSGHSVVTPLSLKTQITKNFAVWELANKQAKEDVKLVITPDAFIFLRRIQKLRDRIGKPINLSSAYRTKSFNDSLPNASKNSLHLDLRAIDAIKIPYKEQDLYIGIWYEFAKEEGFVGGVNRYPDRLHIDDGEDKFGYKQFVVRDYVKMKNGKPTITLKKL